MHILEEKEKAKSYTGLQRQIIRAIRFEVMIGVKMKTSEQLEIKKCIEDNLITIFQDERNERRSSTVVQIAKVQAEYRQKVKTWL